MRCREMGLTSWKRREVRRLLRRATHDAFENEEASGPKNRGDLEY